MTKPIFFISLVFSLAISGCQTSSQYREKAQHILAGVPSPNPTGKVYVDVEIMAELTCQYTFALRRSENAPQDSLLKKEAERRDHRAEVFSGKCERMYGDKETPERVKKYAEEAFRRCGYWHGGR